MLLSVGGGDADCSGGGRLQHHRNEGNPLLKLPSKRYLSGNEVLRDSFRLARMIFDSHWDPDVMVVLWRGGAPIGIAVHEFFAYKGLRKEHIAIQCASYSGLQQTGTLEINLSEKQLEPIRPGRRILIIDDIFDTGKTAMRVREILEARGAEVRIATLFWKPANNCTAGRPDYYLHETDQWIVFPHELDGLAPVEVRQKDAELYALLHE